MRETTRRHRPALDGRLSVRIAAVALSGILYALTFPPARLGALAWVALASLLWALWDQPPGRAFGFGFTFGLIAFAINLTWIQTFGPAAWILLAAYLALYTGVFGAVTSHLARTRSITWLPWIVATVWVASEFLRALGPMAFPWTLLGHALWQSRLLGLASITGVYGISFVVALVNGLATVFLLNRRPRVVGTAAAVAAVVAGALTLGGSALGASLGPLIRVAAVQPNISAFEESEPDFPAWSLYVLREQTFQAGRQGAVLVVWPESAASGPLVGTSLGREVSRVARAARITLVASAIEADRTNSAVLYGPDGAMLGRYDKVRLVAFGEAGTRPGRAQVVYPTPAGRVGIAMSFESVFPDVSRTLAQQDASVLAVMTNNSWWAGKAVLTVPRLSPGRRGQQTDVLIVPDRFGVHSDFVRQLPDPHHGSLDSDSEGFFDSKNLTSLKRRPGGGYFMAERDAPR